MINDRLQNISTHEDTATIIETINGLVIPNYDEEIASILGIVTEISEKQDSCCEEIEDIKDIVTNTQTNLNTFISYSSEQLIAQSQVNNKIINLLNEIVVKIEKCCKCDKCKNYLEKDTEEENGQ